LTLPCLSDFVAKVRAGTLAMEKKHMDVLGASKDWCITLLGEFGRPGHMGIMYWDEDAKMLSTDPRKWFKYKRMGKTTGWINSVTLNVFEMNERAMLLAWRYGEGSCDVKLMPNPRARRMRS